MTGSVTWMKQEVLLWQGLGERLGLSEEELRQFNEQLTTLDGHIDLYVTEDNLNLLFAVTESVQEHSPEMELGKWFSKELLVPITLMDAKFSWKSMDTFTITPRKLDYDRLLEILKSLAKKYGGHPRHRTAE